MRRSSKLILVAITIFIVVSACNHEKEYVIPQTVPDTRTKSLLHPEETKVIGKMALSLSGGGYRALLFDLGVVWRLNDLGVLQQFRGLSSASGGSILAAYLSLHWEDLQFIHGRAANFDRVIADPILELAHHTIDVPAIWYSLLVPWQAASAQVSKRLDRFLFKGHKLGDFSRRGDAPYATLLATDLETGWPWEFHADRMGFSQLQPIVPSDDILVADAVAASAAFPPFLSPARFHFRGAVKRAENESALPDFAFENKLLLIEAYRHRYEHVVLSDGGLANNLAATDCGYGGLASLCLISDAAVTPSPATIYPTWLGQAIRALLIMYDRKEDQIRLNVGSNILVRLREGDNFAPGIQEANYLSLSKRIDQVTIELPKLDRTYAQWSLAVQQLRTNGYADPDAQSLIRRFEIAAKEAMIPTRLKRVSVRLQAELVDLGYVATDTNFLSYILREHFEDNRPDEFAASVMAAAPSLFVTPLKLPLPLAEHGS